MFAGPLLLVIGGLLAIYEYALDDYRGPSNIWIWSALCGGLGLMLWISFVWHRSRRVMMDDKFFYVTNYLRNEFVIPIRDVEAVTERIYERSKNFVELNLNQPTPLGLVIRFMPRMRAESKSNQSDPVTDELRLAIQTAKAGPPVLTPPS